MTDPRDYDPFPHAPKAGRELDAVVAEKVMGWKRSGKTTAPFGWVPPDGKDDPAYRRQLPHYSTEIAAAWEVVERLISDDWVFTLESNSAGHHAKLGKVINAHIVERQGFADTAPLAICLAALNAKGER